MQENRANRDWIISDLLTVIDTEDLHFCLEYRTVEVCGQEIELTAKEFDIFALLILNPRRVFTYEMIMILSGMNRIMPIPGNDYQSYQQYPQETKTTFRNP